MSTKNLLTMLSWKVVLVRLVTKPKVCTHQPFSKTLFVFFSDICKLECYITSDWLIWFSQSEVVLHSYASKHRKSVEDKECSKEQLMKTDRGQRRFETRLHVLCSLVLIFSVSRNIINYVNRLLDDKILDWSKWKRTADNILKCI